MKIKIMNPDNTNLQRNNSNRVLAGLFIIGIGVVLLLQKMDIVFFPSWLFSWPLILIAVGIFSGIKHGFRGPGWLILIAIGTFFLLDRIEPGMEIRNYILPAALILAGLVFIFRPKNNSRWRQCAGRRHNRMNGFSDFETTSSTTAATATDAYTADKFNRNDFIDGTAIFAGIKRVILSKNFKGGDLTAVMGGTEIDFTQADVQGEAMIDVTAVMGGHSFIIPPTWHVRNEISAVLGGVEDKRQVSATVDANKTLVLKGTVFMGGISIRNY
jgi:predicted membrane protein